jgi:hypothetical protein
MTVDSRRHHQPHHISVPFGDGSEKKFNWASEISTIFPTKPIVVLGGGLFALNHGLCRLFDSVQTASRSPRVAEAVLLQVVDCTQLCLVQAVFRR